MKYVVYVTVLVAMTLASMNALAQELNTRKNLNESEGKAVYSTKLDFDSTLIDGQMKAPAGFFLQGRNKQSLSNMVKLRSDFRQELRNSRSAIKAMAR